MTEYPHVTYIVKKIKITTMKKEEKKEEERKDRMNEQNWEGRKQGSSTFSRRNVEW